MARLYFAGVLLFLTLMCRAQTGTVILNIEGIQLAQGGELSAGIFTKDNFPKIGKEVAEIKKAVTASQMQITFVGVPQGEYGVAVFQDIDKDKKLKTNLIGLPREPIGFSNDARIRMAPPSFQDARVSVGAKPIELRIILH